MTRTLRYVLLLIFVFRPPALPAQHLSFQHLTVREGMPSNPVGSLCFDSTGFLWMATNDGLLHYDGITLRQYTHETHPGLPRNEIGSLYCDRRNRIWVCTNQGIALVNEHRLISRVFIHDSLVNANMDYCFEVNGLGMVAIGSKRSFLLPENRSQWEPFRWLDDSVRKGKNATRFIPFGQQRYIFFIGNRLLLANLREQRLELDLQLPGVISAARLNDQQLIAITDNELSLHFIDLREKKLYRSIRHIRDQQQRALNAPGVSIIPGGDSLFYITTRGDGLLRFDLRTGQFQRFAHDPLDEYSILSDNLRWVQLDPKGYLAVSSVNGLNFTHTEYGSAKQVELFQDEQQNMYDGAITGIAEAGDGTLWLKNFDGLITWHPQSRRVRTIRKAASKTSLYHPGPITRDRQGRFWEGANPYQLIVYDSLGHPLKTIDYRPAVPFSRGLRVIRQLADGRMVCGSEEGLFLVNPADFSIDSLAGDPALKELSRSRIVDILVDDTKLWLAISPSGAAYCYDFSKRQLRKWSRKDGLSSDRVYCLEKGPGGEIYIGTFDGLNILSPDGSIRQITRRNGLRHHRVENLVADTRGYLWATNYNSLLRYHPPTGEILYFDERHGISNAGFSVATSLLSRQGSIYLGSFEGLLLIDPRQLRAYQAQGPLLVRRLHDDGSIQPIQENGNLHLAHPSGKLNLYFLMGELVGQNRYYFRYRLEGLDTGWSAPTRNHFVSYNLRPGNYTFQVQASGNEFNWEGIRQQFRIFVHPPFWQTWWFRTLLLLLIVSTLYALFRRREKRLKARAAIRQQLAELEGKALRAQMNPHFIFNSLNAIQELVVTENYPAAYEYLSKFSRLLRMVLHHSEKNLVPLSNEIEMNRLFLDLESLRFKQSFHYSLDVAEGIDTEALLYPPLLLQPFIENAIWHGLLPRDGEKRLLLRFTWQDNAIQCCIEDNGIGRRQSAAIKESKLGARHFESKGSVLAAQRIANLPGIGLPGASVQTTDLLGPGGEALGTRVTIIIPATYVQTLTLK